MFESQAEVAVCASYEGRREWSVGAAMVGAARHGSSVTTKPGHARDKADGRRGDWGLHVAAVQVEPTMVDLALHPEGWRTTQQEARLVAVRSRAHLANEYNSSTPEAPGRVLSTETFGPTLRSVYPRTDSGNQLRDHLNLAFFVLI